MRYISNPEDKEYKLIINKFECFRETLSRKKSKPIDNFKLNGILTEVKVSSSIKWKRTNDKFKDFIDVEKDEYVSVLDVENLEIGIFIVHKDGSVGKVPCIAFNINDYTSNYYLRIVNVLLNNPDMLYSIVDEESNPNLKDILSITSSLEDSLFIVFKHELNIFLNTISSLNKEEIKNSPKAIMYELNINSLFRAKTTAVKFSTYVYEKGQLTKTFRDELFCYFLSLVSEMDDESFDDSYIINILWKGLEFLALKLPIEIILIIRAMYKSMVSLIEDLTGQKESTNSLEKHITFEIYKFISSYIFLRFITPIFSNYMQTGFDKETLRRYNKLVDGFRLKSMEKQLSMKDLKLSVSEVSQKPMDFQRRVSVNYDIQKDKQVKVVEDVGSEDGKINGAKPGGRFRMSLDLTALKSRSNSKKSIYDSSPKTLNDSDSPKSPYDSSPHNPKTPISSDREVSLSPTSPSPIREKSKSGFNIKRSKSPKRKVESMLKDQFIIDTMLKISKVYMYTANGTLPDKNSPLYELALKSHEMRSAINEILKNAISKPEEKLVIVKPKEPLINESYILYINILKLLLSKNDLKYREIYNEYVDKYGTIIDLDKIKHIDNYLKKQSFG